MSGTEEATINPDGSTTFNQPEPPPTEEPAGEDFEPNMEGLKGTDPALFLLVTVLLLACLWFYVWWRSKKTDQESDPFFSNLDGEKFNLKLPAAVDEYYTIKEKCEQAGWKPGQKPAGGANATTGPHRVMAQALMKRCIADIPIVTHIQKESAGMNKLYSQSMCSVKQWRAYQAAEAMVSAEVDEVRTEADEIEPGWSQVIWRQAMQYHNMLKQRHEMESKVANAEAAKKKEVEDAKAKELAAEKAAQELIRAEEREKESKKFGGGMKKGFLNAKSGGKKK
mmetsp:Transcript_5112/g.7896  ORF Transcript_5112/g.7896 Transcript_5112/m.7896 type:complete len:281 (-) Transcript_5112:1401-2243(-)